MTSLKLHKYRLMDDTSDQNDHLIIAKRRAPQCLIGDGSEVKTWAEAPHEERRSREEDR